MDPLFLLMTAVGVVVAVHAYSERALPPAPPPPDPDLALLRAVEQLIVLDAWAAAMTDRIVGQRRGTQ